ncbi:MAG: alkylphosphonate utilization protein [Acholeplasmataceae bacterium]|jgi:protein PhnA|nr:alkylphosphonate utilization protein [Acholeplasmataceae bacterium]
MKCISCGFEYTYEEDGLVVCAACQYRWNPNELKKSNEKVYLDAYGTPLEDGDTVIVIKDLKVKGSSSVVKQGTKVTNIKLVDSDHDIDCRIPGIGAMSLKTEFVKKA